MRVRPWVARNVVDLGFHFEDYDLKSTEALEWTCKPFLWGEKLSNNGQARL